MGEVIRGVIRSIGNGCLIAFSMYSRIPVPRAEWNRENMRYAMGCFPLVGAVEGVLFYALWRLCMAAGLGTTLSAVLGTLLPVAVTGGIHLDGLMDTSDALGSCQPPEKKLEILKDSRAGAFGVLSCCGYLLLTFGIYAELFERYTTMLRADAGAARMEEAACRLAVLSLIFVISRALSGMAVVSFPCAKGSGLAASFADAAEKRPVRIMLGLYLAAAGVGMAVLDAGSGICALAAAGLTFVWYAGMSRREFGGITGDLAGWFLEICELAMTAGCLLGWILL